MRTIEYFGVHRMRRAGLFVIIFFCSVTFAPAQQNAVPPASAQQNSRTVERTMTAESGKVARIGAYMNIKSDCTSGPLPILRLTEAPQGGKVVIKSAKVRVTNVGACLSTEAPGLIAFYQSRPDFSGPDKVAIEAKFPDRDSVNVQKITINVRASGMNL
jgi:hypothetical protein